MNDIAARIRELIEHLSLTNKGFAESIEVAPAIISHVLSGRNNPSLHLVQQITNVYTNVNLAYLLNGSGQLLNEATDQKDIKSERTAISTTKTENPLPPGARYVSVPSGAPLPKIEVEKESIIEASSQKDSSELRDTPSQSHEKTEKEDFRRPEKKLETSVYKAEGKQVERIVVFYSDRSFREYFPEG